MAMKAKPFTVPAEEEGSELNECNCSICARNGVILTYPLKTQITITGQENLGTYSFLKHHQKWKFCKICGVTTHIEKDLSAVSKEDFDSWSEDDKKTWATIGPVNAKCFDGVEWDDERVAVEKGNWRDVGGKYVVPE